MPTTYKLRPWQHSANIAEPTCGEAMCNFASTVGQVQKKPELETATMVGSGATVMMQFVPFLCMSQTTRSPHDVRLQAGGGGSVPLVCPSQAVPRERTPCTRHNTGVNSMSHCSGSSTVAK